MIRIYSPRDITEAYLIKGLLEQDNIPVHVTGLYLQGGIGELPVSDLLGVNVPDEYQQLALSIIEQYEQATPIAPMDTKDCE